MSKSYWSLAWTGHLATDLVEGMERDKCARSFFSSLHPLKKNQRPTSVTSMRCSWKWRSVTVPSLMSIKNPRLTPAHFWWWNTPLPKGHSAYLFKDIQRPLAQGILKNCSWEVIILSTIFFVSKSKSFFFHQKFGGSFNIQTCSWLVSPFLRGISSPKTTRQRSRDGFVRVLDGAARARLYEGSKSTCRPRCATLVGRFRGEQNYMVLGGSSQDL